MAYVRKTRDEYEIQGYYESGRGWTGYEWEVVTVAETWKEARENLRCYNENERGTHFQIVTKRVKIDG